MVLHLVDECGNSLVSLQMGQYSVLVPDHKPQCGRDRRTMNLVSDIRICKYSRNMYVIINQQQASQT